MLLQLNEIKVEKLHYLKIRFTEIHQNIRRIFSVYKFFNNIAFPYCLPPSIKRTDHFYGSFSILTIYCIFFFS